MASNKIEGEEIMDGIDVEPKKKPKKLDLKKIKSLNYLQFIKLKRNGSEGKNVVLESRLPAINIKNKFTPTFEKVKSKVKVESSPMKLCYNLDSKKSIRNFESLTTSKKIREHSEMLKSRGGHEKHPSISTQ